MVLLSGNSNFFFWNLGADDDTVRQEVVSEIYNVVTPTVA